MSDSEGRPIRVDGEGSQRVETPKDQRVETLSIEDRGTDSTGAKQDLSRVRPEIEVVDEPEDSTHTDPAPTTRSYVLGALVLAAVLAITAFALHQRDSGSERKGTAEPAAEESLNAGGVSGGDSWSITGDAATHFARRVKGANSATDIAELDGEAVTQVAGTMAKYNRRAGLVFWIKGPQTYYRLVASPEFGQVIVQAIDGDQSKVLGSIRRPKGLLRLKIALVDGEVVTTVNDKKVWTEKTSERHIGAVGISAVGDDEVTIDGLTVSVAPTKST
jgi:hypothetical protein